MPILILRVYVDGGQLVLRQQRTTDCRRPRPMPDQDHPVPSASVNPI
jgi:hypothetical protein